MKNIEKASVAQSNDFVSRVRVAAVRLAVDTLDNPAATLGAGGPRKDGPAQAP